MKDNKMSYFINITEPEEANEELEDSYKNCFQCSKRCQRCLWRKAFDRICYLPLSFMLTD